MAKKLLAKNERPQLNAIGRWGYLVDKLLKRQPIFNLPKAKTNGGRVSDRWKLLITGLAFKLGNEQLWLNLDHFCAK